MYHFRYDVGVRRQLRRAVTYYQQYHPNTPPTRLLELAQAAFKSFREFPYAAPTSPLDAGGLFGYRKVRVWRFVFVYRVDEANRELVVDRIYHERAAG